MPFKKHNLVTLFWTIVSSLFSLSINLYICCISSFFLFSFKAIEVVEAVFPLLFCEFEMYYLQPTPLNNISL